MRITRQEVLDATGAAAAAVEQLTELSMANKYVHEVGFVAKMAALRELNLAFNELTSAEDLCRNAALEQLNVSHNSLRSLEGLGALAQLRTLRASHNRLREVRPLAQCRSLEECWLQSNRLIDLEAVVEALRALPRLRCLVLLGNPVCERAEYRAWVISQLPNLETLDGQPVAEERSQRGDAPAPQLGRLSPTALDVLDHSGSDDDEVGGGGGDQLRRGEWTVTDSRGQKVHMGKHKNKAARKAAAPPRRVHRGYDYGLQSSSTPTPRELRPAEELRQALAGLKVFWTIIAEMFMEKAPIRFCAIFD